MKALCKYFSTVLVAVFVAITITLIFVNVVAKKSSIDSSIAQSVVKVIVNESSHGSATYIGNGYYLTAAHVVENKMLGPSPQEIFKLKDDLDGTTYASVVWSETKYDIALLQDITYSKLEFDVEEGGSIYDINPVPAKVDCNPLSVGDEVEMRGNPFYSDFVVTWGKVSKINVSFYDKAKIWADAVFVDGNLAPGMSGGGVFNEDGKLIGVNVGILTYPNPVFIIPTGMSVIVPVTATYLCPLQ